MNKINQLSGGEADRVSLALTLAMCRLSKSPILMLDESLSTLDTTTKEMAIKAMTHFTQNLGKTIIVIDHAAIQGNFDNTVEF